LHRLAEDAERNASFTKMGGKGQAIGAGTNNRCMHKI
jgi:hypothetical protein